MVARGLEFDVSQRKSNKEKGESRGEGIEKRREDGEVWERALYKMSLGD